MSCATNIVMIRCMRFKKLQQIIFLILLSIISLAFLYVINDYLMPVFWAVVLAIIFIPVHRKLLQYVKYPSLSSAITLLSILIVIFVPLFFVGSLVLKESVGLYQQITVTTSEGGVTVDLFDRFGEAASYLERFNISEEEAKEKIVSYAGAATNWLTDQAVSFGSKTFTITLQFFLMLYVLFFLLKDGAHIEKRLIEILPLGDRREKKLFAKFTSTTRAVVKGTLVVGVVQGLIGGILFSIAGIKGALLWGVLMTIVSVVPAVGAVVVWLPAGIILLLTGSIWQGVLILIGGALIISLIDNILRPILVGKDTKMPDVFILLSTLGGLSIFGITGFVIGPVVAGFFIAMWEMFEEEYHKDLQLHG